MVYSYTSKPPRGKRGENTCMVPSAQIITRHWLSETNSSSNSITKGICSWCAEKSKEVTEFKKGSSNINTSVTLVRKDISRQRRLCNQVAFLHKDRLHMLTAWEPKSYRDAHRGQQWFRKNRDELATPYVEGLHINTWISSRVLGRLHQNLSAWASLVHTLEYTIYVPFLMWSHSKMGLTSCYFRLQGVTQPH